jgi:cellulose synthase/poly-beta-1,6-N-acetylglucosamine synthase-like glycosyltransferase
MMIAALALVFVLALPLLSSVTLKRIKASKIPHSSNWAVVVAVRNEERYLEACLESLLHQQKNRGETFTIYAVNDNSSDRSPEILETYSRQYDCLKVFHTSPEEKNIPGKAGALDVIIPHVKEATILITDADAVMPPTWAKQHLGLLQEYDLSVGVTVPGTRYVEKIEWATMLSYSYCLSRLGVPVTGLGNNMAIRTDMMRKIGSFDQFSDGITEDLDMIKAVVKQGGKVGHSYESELLVTTYPSDSFKHWRDQRLRWFYGAFRTKPLIRLYFFLQYLVEWSLILIGVVYPEFLIVWGVKVTLELVVHYGNFRAIRKSSLLIFYPFYKLYFNLSILVLFVLFALSRKTKWKGLEIKI